MSSVRSWRRVVLGGAVLLGGACGGPQPLGGLGEACVRAADCAPGLVCIEGLCSDDLTGIGADSAGPEPGQGEAGSSNGVAGAPAVGGNTGSGGGPSTGGASSGGTSLGGSAGSN